MNKDVIKLIQQGYSILTPTMRMSRYLKNIYAAEQINMGNIVWESADILPSVSSQFTLWGDVCRLCFRRSIGLRKKKNL